MNLDQIEMLYTYTQIGDNRRNPTDLDIKQWAAILRDCQHLHIAVEAINEHRRNKPGTWLEPGHIVAEYRTIARRILTRYTPPLPAANPDDVAAYNAEVSALRDAWLADPRNLEQIDDPPPAIGMSDMSDAQIVGEIARRAGADADDLGKAGWVFEVRARKTGWQAKRDDDRAAAARAELEAIRNQGESA